MIEGSTPPSTADRSLLRAIRAWGDGDVAACSARFSEAWRIRIFRDWSEDSSENSDSARSALLADHKASARPDPLRVHPSWFVRALKSESPTVRLAVVAHAPSPLGETLSRALEIDPLDLATDRKPDPEILNLALALWAERLVGDVPDLDSDLPVVMALTRIGPRELIRLVKTCGLAKLAFSSDGNGSTVFDESIARFIPLDRVRLGYFRRHIGVSDPRLIPQAKIDLGLIESDRGEGLYRVGLVTFGRLLTSVEPHRARWALQHLPYPVAKQMRINPTSHLSSKNLLAWESWVLEAAWARLLSEGRMTVVPVPSFSTISGDRP